MPRFFSTKEQQHKFLSNEARRAVNAGVFTYDQYVYERLNTGEPSSTTLSSSTDSTTPDTTSHPSSVETNSTTPTHSIKQKIALKNTQAMRDFAADDIEQNANKNPSSTPKKKSSRLLRCLFCCFGISVNVDEGNEQKQLEQNLLDENHKQRP